MTDPRRADASASRRAKYLTSRRVKYLTSPRVKYLTSPRVKYLTSRRVKYLTSPRAKYLTLVVGILVAGLTIIAWTQPWFTVRIDADSPTSGAIEVGGDVAAGGLAGLGLAGLALVGALSIAGRIFRLILGVLQVLLGATVTLSAVLALLDPVAASGPAITEATGESGSESVRRLVAEVGTGFWPYAATVLGVAAIVFGVVVIATSARWPASARKYQAVRFEPDAASTGPRDPGSRVPLDVAPSTELDGARPGADGDPVADWDALSDGSDPTAR